MAESFAPTVLVDGKTVTPRGWMWVLGFAIAGCEWAIREASTEDFRSRAKLWFAEREAYYLKNDMAYHQRRLDAGKIEYSKTMLEIERLKTELRITETPE